MVPLGYVSRDKKLVVEHEEAERVRTIFRRYLKTPPLRFGDQPHPSNW
jgi:hypothetical protein